METTTTKLIAFHGQAAIKDKYLHRVRAHREADELIHGTYWQDGKGCAVGCTVHSARHADYEDQLGIPRALARIEDGIFEGLSNGEAKGWPEKFLAAIPVGADLSGVTDRLLHWLLVDPTDGVLQFAKTDSVKKAIRDVGALYARKIAGEAIETNEWWNARRAAYAADAADAAYDAADAAAYAADAAAADAAAYAADAAAAAAYAADRLTTARTAREKMRACQARKLIELLSACQPPAGASLAVGKGTTRAATKKKAGAK